MTTFQHKTLPITIGYSEYINLSTSEKDNFNIVNPTQSTNNTYNTTTVTNETKDVLGLGEAVGIAVVAPLAIGAALLGFFD